MRKNGNSGFRRLLHEELKDGLDHDRNRVVERRDADHPVHRCGIKGLCCEKLRHFLEHAPRLCRYLMRTRRGREAVPEARIERVFKNNSRFRQKPARLRETDRKPRGGSAEVPLLIERCQKNKKFARKLIVGT